MKKKIVYPILLLIMTGAVGFVVIRYQQKAAIPAATKYPLLPRKEALSQSADWPITQNNAAKLSQKLLANPSDTKSLMALANLYILEARATGNYTYYDQAAMQLVNQTLAITPDHFEALTLKALIHLSQHHFSDGLAVAEKAVATNPYNAFLYGVLVDAQVEMGQYKKAVESATQMMDIRPDIRSYARAAYLREIHGDYPGAIKAMALAIDAGYPGEESTEWCKVQLGHLFQNTGETEKAIEVYNDALKNRPNYPQALGALGQICLLKGNYPKAIEWLTKADDLVPDVTYKESLANAYRLNGQIAQGDSLADVAIETMTKNAIAAKNDENIGHYADKELAYAYLAEGKFGKAVEHALAEYNRRPDNIEVNEALAWVYFKMGDVQKAMKYLPVALKTNSKNPTLLARAGLIYIAAGDSSNGIAMLRQATQSGALLEKSLQESVVAVLAKNSQPNR